MHLRAYDIDASIPDRHMAANAWHYSQALGGIRVMVPNAQLEHARMILEHLTEIFTPITVEDSGDYRPAKTVEEELLSLRKAVFLGILVWPLVHLYTTYRGLRLMLNRELNDSERLRAGLYTLLSIASVALFCVVASSWV